MGKFQPYPVYRDSGIEWAPECPEGWDVVPTFAASVENRRNNSAGAIDNVLSLSYGRIVRRDVETNFGLLPESFNTYQIVQPGHIVMRLTDLQNDKRSLRVGFVEEGGIITSAYLGLQFNQRFRPKFAYYLLHAYDLYKVYYGMGGGLRQTMKFSDLKWLPLFCPPVSEQENIAAFLDHETAKIDRLIARQERLIELLKEKRQAVISHAVTKGLNPDAPMKDSGVEWLGEVPAHWDVQRLKRLSQKVVTGGTPSGEDVFEDGDLDWFTPGDFKGSIVLGDAAKKVRRASSDVKKWPADTVLIIGIGATLGKVALSIRECSANQQINAVVPNRKIRSLFLAYALSSMQDAMRELSNAATIGIMNQEKTKQIWLAAPPLDEQEAIEQYLRGRLQQFSMMERKALRAIELLKEHRIALISAAVTGKIDVRNFKPANA